MTLPSFEAAFARIPKATDSWSGVVSKSTDSITLSDPAGNHYRIRAVDLQLGFKRALSAMQATRPTQRPEWATDIIDAQQDIAGAEFGEPAIDAMLQYALFNRVVY